MHEVYPIAIMLVTILYKSQLLLYQCCIEQVKSSANMNVLMLAYFPCKASVWYAFLRIDSKGNTTLAFLTQVDFIVCMLGRPLSRLGLCNERVVFPNRAHKLDKSQPENTSPTLATSTCPSHSSATSTSVPAQLPQPS